jgi:hypothetical protein
MSNDMDELYSANLALYEKLVATNPKVVRKGKTMPYTSLNGHMFSMLTKEGAVALRLPAGEREAFLEKYETTQPVQYGTVMKEYVVVPAGLLERTGELQTYFEMSYGYVGSLRPKATTRKKKPK